VEKNSYKVLELDVYTSFVSMLSVLTTLYCSTSLVSSVPFSFFASAMYSESYIVSSVLTAMLNASSRRSFCG